MNKNEFEANLDVLEILTEALTNPRTLADGLEQITSMTCRLMDTTQAAFLLIDEEHHQFIVQAAVGLQSPYVRNGLPLLNVPERLLNILWRLQNLHQINWVDSGIEGIIFPIIAMPIRFKGKRIGHLLTGGARDTNATKNPARRKLFSLLAPFASLVIENAKATDLLTHRLAMHSQELLADASKESADASKATEQLIVNSLQNPEKVVRLLAESFHRELTQAGFSPENIAVAAAKLIDCITNDLIAKQKQQ
ncbi:MAG: hypothetical protein J6866_01230 [Victivallales bacterium]|nr:hypothetical protein [Victivallales bacterium]